MISRGERMWSAQSGAWESGEAPRNGKISLRWRHARARKRLKRKVRPIIRPFRSNMQAELGTAARRIPTRWSRSGGRSRQKRNRSSFFRFANMGSTVGVQTWREQLYKCRREREERRSRTSAILAECENLRGLCTNSSSSPSSSPREGALFQLEPPRPVERDLRERDPIVYIYIYIKPPFIRDNKQSCYRREINIVTFIRGQIEGANEPAIACVSLRSANQSFFHADKAFGRRLSPITRRPREQKRPIFPRLVAAAEDIPRNNRGCSGFQIETARFPRNSPPFPSLRKFNHEFSRASLRRARGVGSVCAREVCGEHLWRTRCCR